MRIMIKGGVWKNTEVSVLKHTNLRVATIVLPMVCA